jgi:hypothetical protein
MSDIASLLLSGSGRRYKSTEVEVDGKPVTVWLKSLNSRERDAFEESTLEDRVVRNKKGKKITKRQSTTKNIRAKLVVACACVGDGNPTPLFTIEQVEQLGEVDSVITDQIFEAASELTGIKDVDIEELAKN